MRNPLELVDRDPDCWLAGAEAALNLVEQGLSGSGAVDHGSILGVRRVRMLVRAIARASQAGSGRCQREAFPLKRVNG